MTTRSVADCLHPKKGTPPGRPYDAVKGIGIAAIAIPGVHGQSIAHAGILYRWKKLEVRLFEMRNHKELRDVPAPPDFVWVEPAIPPERMRLVISRARLVYDCHKKNAVPYGFGYRTSAFDEKGGFRIGDGEIGFTCSTIVAAILESERLKLIDPTAWPAPDSADKQTRQAYLEYLQTTDPAHAKLLATDIESPRISPEEVVAAAAMHPEVGTYDTLQDGAAHVRQRIGT